MAKVLIDTNVILDYLSASRPEHVAAVDLFAALFEVDGHEPVIAASSLKDAYYILCRMYHREDLVRERLRDFCEIVGIEELTRPVIDAAFASDEADFEDGVVRATAELCEAEAIVTRDVAAFGRSPVLSMTPREFCQHL